MTQHFKYLGEILNHEVNDLLRKAHILVNTSEYEGFSNTFVQAWMRKVVVLCMNSNPDEIITNENIGFVCPSLELLKSSIDLLIKDPNTLHKKSENAYKYAVENHTIDNNIDKVISLMQ